MKILLSSPKKTKKEDRIYVIETPSVIRRKVRGVDITNELASIERELVALKQKKVELLTIKVGIDKLK